MRLRRLDLVRYGHFTDSSLELPEGKSDFHIIYGPNEAGKSTALAAIEDLLFGIPTRSRYSFLHDYGSMRIGAILEKGSSSLEVLRRKGSKDTLLGVDGSPVAGGESVLSPYLAGADRSFFGRMFSLDHVRLQAGGQEILKARDDIGQMLFSAGAGIAGLRENLGELCAEAEELWSPRRARHRRFYIAADKLKEAQKTLREQTLTARKWQELKRAHEETEEAYAEVVKKIEKINVERNRLFRIRRVFRDVRRMQELDDQLAELGDTIALPEEAEKVVLDAEGRDREAATRIATLQEQLARAEENLGELTFDESIIQRAKDIEQLHERRIEIRGEKADLPKREAELNAAEESLRAYASELEWTETDPAVLIESIPPRTKGRVVRSLLNQRGELVAGVRNYTRALQESQKTHDGLKEQLANIGKLADVSRLAIVIRTLRERGDITGQVRTAENALRNAQRVAGRRLQVLNPGDIDEEILKNMTVPPKAMVQEFREREQDWKRRLREARQEIASAQQELNGAAAALDRGMREEKVVTAEELNDARHHRDALWNLVKLAHVQGVLVPEDEASGFEAEMEDLAGAFEPAMARVDDLADRRFDRAEAAGRIAEIKRKIGDKEMLLKQHKENEARLVEEGEHLNAEWATIWDSAPFDPLAAESMLVWLEARETMLEAVEERERAESALDALRSEEREAREQLLSELEALGVGTATLEVDSMNVILERAAEEHRYGMAENEKEAMLEGKIRNAAEEVASRERDLREARNAQSEWQEQWTRALVELGLAKSTAPEVVSGRIEVIDEMREAAGSIRSLRHDRIDKINRDITDFEKVVGDLVSDLAKDPLVQPAENAVFELEKRLAEAQRARGMWERTNKEVEELTTKISQFQNERGELTAAIAGLMTLAKVETNDALMQAIKRSDQYRSAELARQQVIEKLEQDGDGKSIEELVNECEGTVIDEVVAREDLIQADLDDLQVQQTNAAEQRSRAREAFQAVGGDDVAACAEAAKQEALVELEEVAERYVRVRTSAMLLQWAIDRYRKEKQAPLLKRASELFKMVTRGSFSSLQIAYDDQDDPHLTGVRHGGRVVPVSGLSTGTSDQLYLALRVASIEDYLSRADALPFIADDLFINFDNERAAAGFKSLYELSRSTQVLFFTHHQHLVDIARNALGSHVNPVNLIDYASVAA